MLLFPVSKGFRPQTLKEWSAKDTNYVQADLNDTDNVVTLRSRDIEKT